MENSNILNNLKDWLSRNWSWLLFVICVAILGQIDQDDRAPYFLLLFLFPLGLMVWYYWNQSYDSKFEAIETNKKHIDNRVHRLRTEKQNAHNLFALLQDCDTDYKILEIKKKNLQNQKERDVTVCICIILLLYIIVLPTAIGLLGWHNIIEMLS